MESDLERRASSLNPDCRLANPGLRLLLGADSWSTDRYVALRGWGCTLGVSPDLVEGLPILCRLRAAGKMSGYVIYSE